MPDPRDLSGSSGDPEAGAGESLELGPLGSRSWAATADAEIQRELISSRVFEGAPFAIDRFEVEKLVGAGSSATVYAARDPLLDRRVAIKVLARPRPDRLAAATERLIREARALAHLSHRNVVVIYEVGQWKDRPFIAMELIEGTTLAQWIVAERRPVADILAVFREAGLGLAAAHARGHVHRDFKPANVLVSNDGRVVVSDFGLVDDAAQDTSEASRCRAPGDAGLVADDNSPRRPAVGTPAYVAPEQRAGAVAHPAADVYSFAVALVEATLGYHPMPASGDRWKSALRGRVSGRVHRELCSAIASDPRQRTQSLAPLLDSLAVRRDGRRRFAAAVVLASAAVGVAIALTWHRTPSALSELRPLSGSPSELFREATELLAVPAERRDDRWSERTRSLVMLPIPARVPCRWPAAQRTVAFAEDTIVMLDVQDRVVSCEISTGIVSILASDVICLRPTDDDTVFGLAFRDGRIALYHRRGRSEAGRDAGAEAGRNAGWSELDAPALAGYADGARPNALCHFFVSSQGIVPPQISLSGPNAGLPADRLAVRAGDRRLTVTADAGLVSQTGDLPPQLLVAPPVERFRVDDALHVGLVVSAGRVGIVDATTGSVVAETPAGSPRLEHSSIDLSRDGSAAVALWIDGPLLWWRRGERQWHRQPVTISGTDVRVSPRGERALTLDVIGRLDVYELAAGRRHPLADAQIQMAAFLDDDHVVAIDSTGSVWRWSLAQLRASVLADHPAPAGTNLWGFAVCDSERSVVTATNGTDAGIEVSSPSGAPRMALSVPPGTQIYGIACRGDRILAGTIDGHVLEWEWPTRRLLAEHDVGVRSWIWAIATAQPAGGPRVDLFGTGNTRAQPRSGGHVVALRGGALTQIFTASLSGNTGIDDIAVSADGQRVAIVASSGQLAVADVASGTTTPPVHAHNEEARRVRFTDADRSLITGGDDGSLRAWRVDDLAMESQINLGNGPIYDLDVHGSIAVAATRNGHVGTWDVAARQMIRAYRGHTAPVGVVRFDPSGQWIASGDFAGRLCVYRADRERCYVELTGHKPVPIRHLQFLRDGQLVTASDDGTVRQWAPPYDAPDSELACELETRLADPERIDCAAR